MDALIFLVGIGCGVALWANRDVLVDFFRKPEDS